MLISLFPPGSPTIPIHHWNLPLVSTSYVRTKSSVPSSPTRNTERPAGTLTMLDPWRTLIGAMVAVTSTRALGSRAKVRT